MNCPHCHSTHTTHPGRTTELGYPVFRCRECKRSFNAAFRGDKTKYNPEELLVSSISACHMLWYLHLCAEALVVVTHYVDQAVGTISYCP